MLREVFSMPPGYLLRKRKLATIVLLSAVGLAFEALAVSYILQQNQNVNYAARVELRNMAALTARTSESRADLIGRAVVVAVFPLLSIPILAVGARVRRAARRAAVTSVVDVRANDKREPLLFLRSFADDQVALSPTDTDSIFHRAFVRGSVFSNIDAMLTERYWHVGPVFAIGKPGERLPPLGAAREYLVGEGWQAVVNALMTEARAIILTLDQTEGVMWELRHTRDAGFLNKLIILIPPHRRGDIQVLGAALAVLGAETERIDRPDAEAAIALLPVSSHQYVILRSKRTDSYAYDLVLRLGMQVLLAGDRSAFGLSAVSMTDQSDGSE